MIPARDTSDLEPPRDAVSASLALAVDKPVVIVEAPAMTEEAPLADETPVMVAETPLAPETPVMVEKVALASGFEQLYPPGFLVAS